MHLKHRGGCIKYMSRPNWMYVSQTTIAFDEELLYTLFSGGGKSLIKLVSYKHIITWRRLVVHRITAGAGNIIIMDAECMVSYHLQKYHLLWKICVICDMCSLNQPQSWRLQTPLALDLHYNTSIDGKEDCMILWSNNAQRVHPTARSCHLKPIFNP